MDAKESNVKFGQVIARAWSDDAYKARLLETPREAFKEAGLDLPAGVQVTVVEQTGESASDGKPSVIKQTDTQFVLNLPPPPADFEDMELDDERLAAVAGGDCDYCRPYEWW